MKVMKICQEEEILVTQTTAMRNHAIAHHYLKILEASIEEWNGKGGTVGKIVKHLGIPKESSSLVKNVLLDVEYALTMGEKMTALSIEAVLDDLLQFQKTRTNCNNC
jgi:hypothetical protein